MLSKVFNSLIPLLFSFSHLISFVQGSFEGDNKLIANNFDVNNGLFGFSTSISGSLVVVGSYQDNSAYVFDCSNLPCQQKDRLVALDASAADMFGFSTSISGSLVVVGSYAHDIGTKSDQGSAYVFDCSNFPCSMKSKLTADDGASGDNFGYSVSISGNLVVVGSYLSDGLFLNQGSAYVYDCSSAKCIQKSKLVALDGGDGDGFGVSVSASGSLVVVGSYLSFVNFDQGSAYLFDCTNFQCVQKDKMIANDGSGSDYFGHSVSISGNLVVIGAQGDDETKLNQGSAYVFDCSSFPCQQKDKLVASDVTAGSGFGTSVSISGKLVVVGAYLDDFNNIRDGGSAYVYDCSNTVCQQKDKLRPLDVSESDYFGRSVSIDGTKIIVGSFGSDQTIGGTTYPGRGSAYFYDDGCFVNNGGCEGYCSRNFTQINCYCLYDFESGFPFTIGGKTIILNNCLANQYGSNTRYCKNGGTWDSIITNCQPCPQGTNSPSNTPSISGCVNPCAKNNGGCSSGYLCTNNNGQVVCSDVNECSSNPCSIPNSYCTNTPGSYSCNCLPGYIGNGKTLCSPNLRTSYLNTLFPIARFTFDGTTIDSSGKKVSIQIGSSSYSPNFYQRNYTYANQALKLLGNTRLTFPITLSTKVTIEILFNVQSFSTPYDLLMLLPPSSTQKSQALFIISGSKSPKIYWLGPLNKLLGSANVIKMGVTHSLVVTIRNGYVVTFLDDKKLNSFPFVLSSGKYSLSIGNMMNGFIDEIGVYNTPIFNPPGNTLNNLTQCVNTCPLGKVCVNTPTGPSCA